MTASLAALVVSAGSLLTGPDGLDARPVPGGALSVADSAPLSPPLDTSEADQDSEQTSSPPTAKKRTTRSGETGRRSASPKPKPPAQPARPRQLTVPRLDLNIPIVPTRIDRAGGMELPDRPDRIGWYAYGPRPGSDEGSAVLGGHVDSSRYGIGPLVELRRLRTGDRIVVQTADGDLAFRVNRIELISKRALDLDEVFDRDGRPVLRILTCGGPYLPNRGGYQDNVVVTAVRS